MFFLQNISKQYGKKVLFSGLSVQINRGSRLALVGQNGAGKSTLLKIIAGETEADSGTMNRAKHATVGYLPQDGVYKGGKTLYKEAATVFQDISRLELRVSELADEITIESESGNSNSASLEDLLEEMGQLQNLLECRESYKMDAKIKKILFGLGFKEQDLSRMTEEFSGGWQMRIELAKLLLAEPSVLLLDEPTNHLDIDSLQWLENYLATYGGSIVLVSHDSRFLDNLVHEVLELSGGKANGFSGNYSSYLLQKSERQRIAEASYANQQKKMESTNRFIERFRYKSTKARQVQSRIKSLQKSTDFELEGSERDIHFTFPEAPRSGRILVSLDRISKYYGQFAVLKDISLTIERNDKIACLGVNGSGKSTLARILAGSETCQNGHRSEGSNTLIAYYGQDVTEKLDPDKTVFQILEGQANSKSPSELRSLLGSFLFTADDVFKPVAVLSGGEKSRLALARILIEPANFLILDEPTNHLDFRSKKILQEKLSLFSGAFFIVSHDRDFLEPLVNKIIFVKENGIELYNGSVDDFLGEIRKYEENIPKTGDPAPVSVSELQKDRKRHEAALRQQKYKKIKPYEESRIRCEKEIEYLEKRTGEIESAFARQETFTGDNAMISSLQTEYAHIKKRLDILYDEWSNIEIIIENLEQEYRKQ
ncbi:MAG: ABC-F family ATP-binding cassette domain-containing protein [Syntrophales bacterium]|jgi:ATP-binding cassette subfamily F protein 3|nr:ABC-F family ATP-binding cassette domain-containing protein [Syntrophales bacterium]MDY0045375.1 ABC-F family ATP-binding cassette domain-containing protein [Syntrophales bacterium]